VTTEASAAESASSSALELNLRALRPILSDPEVTELCINRPGEAFVETAKGGSAGRCPSRILTGAAAGGADCEFHTPKG